MLKFNEGKIVYSHTLRKVHFDLIEETNYSGEGEQEIEIPAKKKYFSYKRYFKWY